MPRAPSYRPAIGAVQPVEARFRAADNGGGAFGALGKGLQVAGQAVGQFAEAQDRIDAQFDDTQARKLALEARTKASALTADYGTKLGGNAVTARAEAEAALKKVREDTFASANNPRMKALLEQYYAPAEAEAMQFVGRHAVKEAFTERQGVLKSEEESYADLAVTNWDKPDERVKAIDAGKASIAALGEMQGAGQEEVSLRQRKFVSGVHRNTVDRMLASVSPDPDAAFFYYEAHQDEMLAADREAVLKDLQGPMQDRQSDSDFTRATGGIVTAPAVQGEPGAGPSLSRMTAITAQSESGNRERGADGALITSPKGAQGAMQVMPGTQRDPGFGITPMRDNSDAERTRVGREYLAKMMERYGNDPAKAWAAYNWGPGNLDKAIEEHGSAWLSAAPAETKRYVNKNMAELDGSGHTAEAPQQWDKDAAYNKIDALADKEGWTWERRERAKKRADQVIARDEQLLARERARADEQAVSVVFGMGEKFTDVSQIPANIRQRLSPADLIKYKGIAEANAKPEPIPANGATAFALDAMEQDAPKAFAEFDLSKLFADLTPAERSEYMQRQAKVRKSLEGWTPYTGINGAVGRATSFGGVKLDDGQKLAVRQIMQAEAERRFQASGKPLGDKEFDELFLSATRDVPTHKWFGRQGSIKRYDETVSTLATATKEKIITAFERTFGRKPSDDEIMQWYRRNFIPARPK